MESKIFLVTETVQDGEAKYYLYYSLYAIDLESAKRTARENTEENNKDFIREYELIDVVEITNKEYDILVRLGVV